MITTAVINHPKNIIFCNRYESGAKSYWGIDGQLGEIYINGDVFRLFIKTKNGFAFHDVDLIQKGD